MISRRTAVGWAACAALSCARTGLAAPGYGRPMGLPVPPGNRLAFNIIRKGGAIGQHVLTFTPDGNALTVNIAVDIHVGLGPITLFRYRHRATERWQAGQFVSIESRTDDDGTDLQMESHRDGNAVVIQGSATAPYRAPPHALPGTHWNKAMLDGPIINTQNGKLDHPAVTPVGLRPLPSGDTSDLAHEYQLRGDVALDTWYDDTPTWMGLRFNAKDGTEIVYERM
jgi:hypothetical protein